MTNQIEPKFYTDRRNIPADVAWWISVVENCSVAIIRMPMKNGGCAAPRTVIIDHWYLDDAEYQQHTIERLDNVCCWWWDNCTGGIAKYHSPDLAKAIADATTKADRHCSPSNRPKRRTDVILRHNIYLTWDDWFEHSQLDNGPGKPSC
jgi:hypothetical protein